MEHPPPLPPTPSGLPAPTPPQGGSHWKQDGIDYRKSLAMTPPGESLEKSTPQASRRNSTRAGIQSFKTIKNHSPFEGNIQLAEDDEQEWFKAIKNHSPLEGESAKQGRSPPASRWGDPSTPCPQPPLHPAAAPARTPTAASDTAGAADTPTTSKTAPGAFSVSPRPARTTPHRCRRRRTAWRHRLPLKGGVIGGESCSRKLCLRHYTNRNGSEPQKITPPLRGSRRNKGEARRRAGGGTPPPHALNRPSTPPQPLPERRRPFLARPVLLASRPRRERRRGPSAPRQNRHRAPPTAAAGAWRLDGNDSPSRGE